MEVYFSNSVVTYFCIALVAIASVFGFWSWGKRKWRARASLGWPIADAKPGRSRIDRHEHAEGGVWWTLRVNFAYRPPGEIWYSGVYSEDFTSKEEAEVQLACLLERRLLARYNPSDPSQCYMDP